MRRLLLLVLVIGLAGALGLVGCHRKRGDAYKMEQVAAGVSAACAAMRDGSIRCWGRNDDGWLVPGGPTALTSPTTTAAVAAIGHAVQVCVGGRFACARNAEGLVTCWGDAKDGQTGGSGLASVTDLVCGEAHACAIAAGKVMCWGKGDSGQLGDGERASHASPTVVPGAAGAASLAAGGATTCALYADGGMRCWGRGTEGQLGNGTLEDHATPALVHIAEIKAVAVGGGHTCALHQDERISCFGRNDEGQLGDGTTESRALPVRVVDVDIASEVTAGARHTCARMMDSTVHCWGKNDVHQAGLSDDPVVTNPKLVPGLYESTAVVAGGDFTCVRMQDGWLRCFGVNDWGQLGDGTTELRNVPTPIRY